MVQSIPTSALDNLTRLAAKPNVKATLVLSKLDGSIIRSTGSLGSTPSAISSEAYIDRNDLGHGNAIASAVALSIEHGHDEYDEGESGRSIAEKFARMIFAFLSAANDFADGMEKGDDTKLLRMRTRNNEAVIVPDWLAFAHISKGSARFAFLCSVMAIGGAITGQIETL
ncbi:MAG: hypothetical protein Q9219_006782 [cf. Caloplaca sp. 3 TL-2023]